MSDKIVKYIDSHWDDCVKYNPNDTETLIGLPYPYTVPAVGHFDELYYWDTYFTNIGLFCCGKESLAKNNVDNMLYLVNKFGFMPNSNRTLHLYNSQPPFLSEMVKDIYNFYKDKVWLMGAYECLKKEYNFWIKKRITPIGLNAFGGMVRDKDKEILAEQFIRRTDISVSEDSYNNIAKHYRVCCESGWDCSPRWDLEGYNYAHVDLNSLLYLFEINMGLFADELSKTEDALIWRSKADERKNLMNKYMLNSENLFLDYNFVNDSKSEIFSAASFMPMFAGLATDTQAQAIIDNIHRLEAPYGIYTCEQNDSNGMYQWDYPNGWACLHYITFISMDKYKFKKEAKRIAEKYTKLVEKVFEETGNLWEKYNVKDGNTLVRSENKMPPMMGWSAGIYLAAKKYVSN